MGEGFLVDLNALEQASSGVNGVVGQVRQQSVSDITCDPSAIGHQQLANMLADFLSRWQRGVDNLAQDGQEIATRLAANVNAYRKVEQDVHNHIKQVNGELEGTGTDPGVH